MSEQFKIERNTYYGSTTMIGMNEKLFEITISGKGIKESRFHATGETEESVRRNIEEYLKYGLLMDISKATICIGQLTLEN